jgi:ectoine hydroxylase-related dioxygenase (phytanoyl-CoA dioxygenase family)
LALTDARDSDGGFLTIPGFSNYLQEWALHRAKSTTAKMFQHSMNVPEDDPMVNQTRTVPVRAGSVIIFDSRQPHSNFPNCSDQFRMVQYIKAFTAREGPEYTDFVNARKDVMMSKLKPHLEDPDNPLLLSDLGKRVLGLESWRQ